MHDGERKIKYEAEKGKFWIKPPPPATPRSSLGGDRDREREIEIIYGDRVGCCLRSDPQVAITIQHVPTGGLQDAAQLQQLPVHRCDCIKLPEDADFIIFVVLGSNQFITCNVLILNRNYATDERRRRRSKLSHSPFRSRSEPPLDCRPELTSTTA